MFGELEVSAVLFFARVTLVLLFKCVVSYLSCSFVVLHVFILVLMSFVCCTLCCLCILFWGVYVLVFLKCHLPPY